MAHNVVLQVVSLRQYMRAVGAVFSLPQWKYFVTVLLGLLNCDETRTLSGILRQVAVKRTLSGLSPFFEVRSLVDPSADSRSPTALQCARGARSSASPC